MVWKPWSGTAAGARCCGWSRNTMVVSGLTVLSAAPPRRDRETAPAIRTACSSSVTVPAASSLVPPVRRFTTVPPVIPGGTTRQGLERLQRGAVRRHDGVEFLLPYPWGSRRVRRYLAPLPLVVSLVAGCAPRPWATVRRMPPARPGNVVPSDASTGYRAM